MVALCEIGALPPPVAARLFRRGRGALRRLRSLPRQRRRATTRRSTRRRCSPPWSRTGQRFGANHIADLLVGEATDALRRHGHDRLKTFGVGHDRPKRSWVAITRQLFAAGALAEASAEHGGFRLTETGESILRGRRPIVLRVVSDAGPQRRRRAERVDRDAAAAALDPPSQALFEHLRALRLDLARREKIAAYLIFPDRTLIEIARQRPTSRAALKAIHGVGDAKLERYGAAFLDAITAFR